MNSYLTNLSSNMKIFLLHTQVFSFQKKDVTALKKNISKGKNNLNRCVDDISRRFADVQKIFEGVCIDIKYIQKIYMEMCIRDFFFFELVREHLFLFPPVSFTCWCQKRKYIFYSLSKVTREVTVKNRPSAGT